jgi:hypothetical protein
MALGATVFLAGADRRQADEFDLADVKRVSGAGDLSGLAQSQAQRCRRSATDFKLMGPISIGS